MLFWGRKFMKKRVWIFGTILGIFIICMVFYMRPISFLTLFEDDESISCYYAAISAEGEGLISGEKNLQFSKGDEAFEEIMAVFARYSYHRDFNTIKCWVTGKNVVETQGEYTMLIIIGETHRITLGYDGWLVIDSGLVYSVDYVGEGRAEKLKMELMEILTP